MGELVDVLTAAAEVWPFDGAEAAGNGGCELGGGIQLLAEGVQSSRTILGAEAIACSAFSLVLSVPALDARAPAGSLGGHFPPPRGPGRVTGRQLNRQCPAVRTAVLDEACTNGIPVV